MVWSVPPFEAAQLGLCWAWGACACGACWAGIGCGWYGPTGPAWPSGPAGATALCGPVCAGTGAAGFFLS